MSDHDTDRILYEDAVMASLKRIEQNSHPQVFYRPPSAEETEQFYAEWRRQLVGRERAWALMTRWERWRAPLIGWLVSTLVILLVPQLLIRTGPLTALGNVLGDFIARDIGAPARAVTGIWSACYWGVVLLVVPWWATAP